MPCEDPTSSMTVKISFDDRLLDYRCEKLTCGKTVGGNADYLAHCSGRPIETLAELPFSEALSECPVESSEEEFLLYLEWKALREALRQYMGLPGESALYRIAEIMTDEKGITIEMIISPPKEMPTIVPCGEKE